MPASSFETADSNRLSLEIINRANASRADFLDQRLESGLDVLHPALAAPVSFGREVDDVLAGLEHEHTPGLDIPVRACRRIGLEVLRVGILELECDTAPHDANAIDRVDECLGVRLQNIPVRYSIIDARL